MNVGAYRSGPSPTYEALFTFSKVQAEAVARDKRRLRFIAFMLIFVAVMCVAGAVALMLISGEVKLAFAPGLAAALPLLAYPSIRARRRELEALDVNVSLCRVTRVVRFESLPSTSVELDASDILALRAREAPLEPVFVPRGGPLPRSSFALVAQTPAGEVPFATPLVCTGRGRVASAQTNLPRTLDDALRRIREAAQ